LTKKHWTLPVPSNTGTRLTGVRKKAWKKGNRGKDSKLEGKARKVSRKKIECKPNGSIVIHQGGKGGGGDTFKKVRSKGKKKIVRGPPKQVAKRANLK